MFLPLWAVAVAVCFQSALSENAVVRYIQEMIENNWNRESFTLPHKIASDIVGLNLDELTIGSRVRSVEGQLKTRGRYVTVGQHIVLRNIQ